MSPHQAYIALGGSIASHYGSHGRTGDGTLILALWRDHWQDGLYQLLWERERHSWQLRDRNAAVCKMQPGEIARFVAIDRDPSIPADAETWHIKKDSAMPDRERGVIVDHEDERGIYLRMVRLPRK